MLRAYPLRRALFVSALLAATPVGSTDGQKPASQRPTTDPTRHGLLLELQSLEGKFIALAGAFPPEKMAWRPAAGVRSVSEVFLHVAHSNFVELARFGSPAPTDVTDSLEKSMMSRDEIVAQLRRSFAHMKTRVASMPPSALAAPSTWPRPGYTTEIAVASMIRHLGEHLGQSIAYARVNGVRPPWSPASSD
jgi:uncharacterized damage-inducible protein DinB